jgi:hypothetical protein
LRDRREASPLSGVRLPLLALPFFDAQGQNFHELVDEGLGEWSSFEQDPVKNCAHQRRNHDLGLYAVSPFAAGTRPLDKGEHRAPGSVAGSPGRVDVMGAWNYWELMPLPMAEVRARLGIETLSSLPV